MTLKDATRFLRALTKGIEKKPEPEAKKIFDTTYAACTQVLVTMFQGAFWRPDMQSWGDSIDRLVSMAFSWAPYLEGLEGSHGPEWVRAAVEEIKLRRPSTNGNN